MTIYCRIRVLLYILGSIYHMSRIIHGLNACIKGYWGYIDWKLRAYKYNYHAICVRTPPSDNDLLDRRKYQ